MSVSEFINWANGIRYDYRADQLYWDFYDCVMQGKEYRDHDLFNMIDEYTLNDPTKRFYKTIKNGTKLYRARIIKSFDRRDYNDFDMNKEYVSGYNELNSREAPLGKSSSGRNNIKGVSYLYVSKDESTACVEVKSSPRDLISLATFQTKTDLKVVDFAFESDKKFKMDEVNKEELALGKLFTYIMKAYINPVRYGEEENTYKITQIITEHIHKSGVDGISYGSYYDRKGVNYTFFNSHINFFDFVSSRMLINQSQRVSFLDFENKNTFSVYSMNDTKYDVESAYKMTNDIRNTIIKSSKYDDGI